jgi:hypothetical protein
MSTNRSNSIPADWLPNAPAASNTTATIGLCLQVAASAIAWMSLGMTDVLITWRTCLGEQFGANTLSRGLYFSVTVLLLGVAVVAGVMSYRGWKKLAGVTGLLRAEGRERSEFLSLAGLYISFTLGAGMVWLGIPLFLLEICVRTR